MIIHNLFSTPVYTSSLDRKLSKKEINFIQSQESKVRKNNGNFCSNDVEILNNPEMANLKKFILTKVNEYFDNIICPLGQVDPYITLSWLNYTHKNEYHPQHCHGNSIISGTLYVQSTDTDKIWFHKNKHSNISLTPKEYNYYNASSWWVSTPQNSIIMFPSDLVHSVAPLETDTTRISLAFNVFCRGEWGMKESLNWLKLN
jgi:uncharacterized protein (TIGR02466 family)